MSETSSPAFNGKASTYDVHAHVQRDTAAWVADWLPEPGAYGRCLEFGAGTGNFTRHLRGRFAALEVSDNAPAMIANGRQELPDVNWTQRDAWVVEGEPQAWDFLASCSLLQWAPNPVEILRRWKQLLRAGGRQLAGIYTAPSLPEFAALMPDRQPLAWRSSEAWRGFFVEAGFGVVRLEELTRSYHYPSARALMRQLHGTGATRTTRPLSVTQMKELLRAYEARFREPAGVVATWTFCRIETVA